MFNSLKHFKKLKAAGIPSEQAEIEIEVLTEVIDTLASKEDLKTLEKRLDLKINAVDSKINYLIILITLLGTILTALNVLHNFFPNLH